MFTAPVLIAILCLEALTSGALNHALFFAVDPVNSFRVLVGNANFYCGLFDCFTFGVDARYQTLSVLIANFSILPRHLPS